MQKGKCKLAGGRKQGLDVSWFMVVEASMQARSWMLGNMVYYCSFYPGLRIKVFNSPNSLNSKNSLNFRQVSIFLFTSLESLVSVFHVFRSRFLAAGKRMLLRIKR